MNYKILRLKRFLDLKNTVTIYSWLLRLCTRFNRDQKTYHKFIRCQSQYLLYKMLIQKAAIHPKGQLFPGLEYIIHKHLINISLNNSGHRIFYDSHWYNELNLRRQGGIQLRWKPRSLVAARSRSRSTSLQVYSGSFKQ